MSQKSILEPDKIRDLFKVKLYTIRSETKREREREKKEKEKKEREREKMRLYIN